MHNRAILEKLPESARGQTDEESTKKVAKKKAVPPHQRSARTREARLEKLR
jgi:hypothetical protein